MVLSGLGDSLSTEVAGAHLVGVLSIREELD